MTTATKSRKKANGKADKEDVIADVKGAETARHQAKMRPIQRGIAEFSIFGISDLITHNWSEKAKRELREKHGGKKTKTREPRNAEAEAEAAAYKTVDGRYGIPGLAVKAALISAAHKDLGIEKVLVRKALFLKIDDPNLVIPITGRNGNDVEPMMREDMVRVGQGSADLRYRPTWTDWMAELRFEIDLDLLTANDLATLVERAGFGVGICEWRPEKGGEFGRFEICGDRPFGVSEITR